MGEDTSNATELTPARIKKIEISGREVTLAEMIAIFCIKWVIAE
jgi:hypothetical protein